MLFKSFYIKKIRLIGGILFTLFALVFSIEEAGATHALPIVNVQSSVSSTQIVISGSSDASTCSGTDAYYMQVEVVCERSGFSGIANYSSEPLYKPNCVEAPYNPVIISFSDLCPGTTYKWKIRERLTGNPVQSTGAWSSNTYYFTTPGSPPPPPTITATAVETYLLCGNSTTVYAQSTGGCGTITYTWVQQLSGGGTVSLGNGKLKSVTPTTTTTYTVTGRDTCTGFTDTESITITVAPSTATSSFTACPGDTINFVPSVPKESLGKGDQFVFTNATKTPIRDMKTYGSEIIVSGMGATSTKNYTVGSVKINLVHSRDRDMIIKLRSPSGDVLNLSVQNGSAGQNYTNTVFTDAAATSITAGTAPFTGNYKPQGTGGLASMIGSAVNGTWTLEVSDIEPNYNEGYIDSWSLTLFDDAYFQNTDYSWNTTYLMTDTTLGTPQVIADTTMSYVLSVKYLSCTYTHTFNLNVHPKVLKADPALPVCNGSPAQLNARGGVSYLWSPVTYLNDPNIANPVATPPTTTKYYVEMVDSIGCRKKDSVILKVGNLPSASAGNNTQVCFGSGVELNASGGTAYAWDDPNDFLNDTTINNPVASPTSNTTFKVTVIDTSTGCGKEAFVDVEVIASPVFTIPDTSICPGDSVMLQATAAPNYLWSPSIGLNDTTIANPIAFPVTTQTYKVAASSATCDYTTFVTVTVKPVPVVNAGNDVVVCENGSLQLSASGADTYLWSPSDGLSDPTIPDPIVYPTFPRSYTVTGTVNGCTDDDVIAINVKPAPVVNAGSDVTICPGSFTQLSAVAYDAKGSVNYAWTPALVLNDSTLANPIATVDTTTIFVVLIQNSDGCTATDTVKVIVTGSPLVITNNSTPVSCWSGNDGTASLSVSGGSGGTYSYSWFPVGSTGPSVQNLPAGLYVVTVTDNNPQCQYQSTIIVDEPQRMNAEYLITNSSCQKNNGGITIIGVTNGTGPFTYSFNNLPGSSINTHSDLNEGNYLVTIADINGCVIKDTVFVPNTGDSVSALFTASAHTGVMPAEIFFTNQSTGATNYIWDFGTGLTSQLENPSSMYNASGEFPVSLIASNNFCSDTFIYNVLILPPLEFVIPNVFTPNGDGSNDIFTISGKGMSSFKGEIFNRWGEKVYEWENSTSGWDGKGAAEGVYYYIITFTSILNETYNYSGHVSLFR